jgi:hypothetical protein
VQLYLLFTGPTNKYDNFNILKILFLERRKKEKKETALR